jgi:hypothetical protein
MPTLKPKIFRALENLPDNLQRITYGQSQREAGDILFLMEGGLDGPVGHSYMIAPDTSKVVHSVAQLGVVTGTVKMALRYLIFRYTGQDADEITQRAARLAREWAADEEKDDQGHTNAGKVGYSNHHLPGGKIGFRTLGAVFGTSKFGKGAKGRLLKYEVRRMFEKLGPTNLICSEMCVLAYQMSCWDESHPAFIKLDAKHTTPATLCRHLLEDDNWTLLGKHGM